MAASIERKLAAILSADVAGYSRLMAEDEAETIRTLGAYRDEIRLLVEQHRGRVADFTGDNFLAEFPTALDAVECAVEIQRVLHARNESLPESRHMEFRIGVHLGDVAVEGERLYGDGVNIAARLEGLAEPGAICVSGEIHGQVASRLEVGFQDLGEQSVKNIPRPVRAYLLRPDLARAKVGTGRWTRARTLGASLAALLLVAVTALWASWPRPLGILLDLSGLTELPAELPLPDRPSIAVLPFANLSADPEQAYFSDGIAEELTNALARIPELFVIARNSAFTYKGRNVDVKQVGRELGVRYVLEGSVRKAGDSVRITAQLVDATSGFQLWSETYDRKLSDIFGVQSDIARQILKALQLEIRQATYEHYVRAQTDDPHAYDAVLRAFAQMEGQTRDGNRRARELLERAAELDPDWAMPHTMLSATYLSEYVALWSRDPAVLEPAEHHALRALELDAQAPLALSVLSYLQMLRDELEEAEETARRALAKAPNFESAHLSLGFMLVRRGRFLEGLQELRIARRINPRGYSPVLNTLGYAQLGLGRPDAAAEVWEEVRAANPDMIQPRLGLALIREREGRLDEAHALVEEIRRVNPDLDAEQAVAALLGQWPEAEQAEFRASLRRAGLP